MLTKRKAIKNGAVPATDPPPFSDVTTPRFQPTATSDGKNIIGEHISIDGTIRGKENLIIEGHMKGKVELDKHHLTIGSKGQVEAEIQADNVTVSGRLIGNIMATGNVKITKNADFTGEIKAKQISVEDGAYLKASIELERSVQPKMGGESKGSGPFQRENPLAPEDNKREK